uniref:Uncharacterized protein n=1 Tax=Raphanus sativus TaxID=3726 RepID=A0A650GB94_RAPSA|nr:hypothetical protein [Raphanus sativus]QGW48439.1 hypothetical protein [Raphanus sativus]
MGPSGKSFILARLQLQPLDLTSKATSYVQGRRSLVNSLFIQFNKALGGTKGEPMAKPKREAAWWGHHDTIGDKGEVK